MPSRLNPGEAKRVSFRSSAGEGGRWSAGPRRHLHTPGGWGALGAGFGPTVL